MKNDDILEDSSDYFNPMAQMFKRAIQTSILEDMLTFSDKV